MRFFLGVAALCLAAGLAHSEEGPDRQLDRFDPLRAVELPSHRSLMRVANRPGAALSAFVTDGCSGGMSAGWAMVADRFPEMSEGVMSRPPWEACCEAHDGVYHDAGGALKDDASFDARLEADRVLRACVIATGEERAPQLAMQNGVSATQVALAYEALAGAMYAAVRLGGGPCTGLPWRWGYGFPQCWAPE